MFIRLLITLAVAGALYFGAETVRAATMHRRMTNIEKANAQIEEDKARAKKTRLAGRVSNALKTRGYDGDWTPTLIIITVLYLVSVVALKLVGLGSWIGGLLAFPAAIMVAVAGLGTSKRRKRNLFKVQLMQALGLIATQVEAGDGAKKAIEKTIGLVEDPLRGEMMRALDSLVGTTSLVEAFKEMETRYPSRAMKLFVAALEIDDTMGARLAPPLRQAQAALEKDFELSAETKAEISQAKGEFYGITAIIGFIVISLVGNAQGISRDVYFSPIGYILLGLAGANYAFGIWRTIRIFRKAGGLD